MNDVPLHHIFVYGTLKSGQVAHKLVAPYVESILPAWTLGDLYDACDWPMLVPGTRRIRGELLRLQAGACSRILTFLDQYEGFDTVQHADSEYVRRVAPVVGSDGTETPAYAYFYNRAPVGLRRMHGLEWPGP